MSQMWKCMAWIMIETRREREESGLTSVDLTLVVVHEAVRKAADME